MVNVDPIEGITYGMRLMGYLIAVFIIGFIVIGIGTVLGGLGASEGDGAGGIVGIIIVLIGGVILYGGFLGIGYKIIADAVEKGINASQLTVSTGGQQRGGRARQQGQGQGQRRSQRRQGQREPQQRQNQRGNRRQ